jgi:hypothetical protein
LLSTAQDPLLFVVSIIPEAPSYASGIFPITENFHHLPTKRERPAPEWDYLHKVLLLPEGKFCSFVEGRPPVHGFCKIPERIYWIMLEFGKDLFYNGSC